MFTRIDEQKIRKAIEEDIPELKVGVAYARQHIDMLHRDVKGLRHDVEELKRNVAELKHDVAELKLAVAALQDDVSVLKEGMSLLLERTARWDTLDFEVKRQGDDIDLLKLMTRDHSQEIALMKQQRAF